MKAATTSSSFMAPLVTDFKEARSLALIVGALTFVAFATLPLLSAEWALRLSQEDGFYEYLTALFFVAGSVVCLRLFLRDRNIWLLLLSLFLFAGFGEEISWGQRILGFSTPEFVDEANVQHEFTIHNLELLNRNGFDGAGKAGWSRLYTIENLFKAICFLYGVAVPLGFMYLSRVRTLIRKVRLPVPHLSLGVFFMVSILVMRYGYGFILEDQYFPWREALEESSECCIALAWLAVTLFFLRPAKKSNGLAEQIPAETREPVEQE